MAMTNTLLLVAQAALYFTVMMTLLQLRKRIGLGVFVCALGVMHFLETYLASVFYVELPFGIISPGSTVLFSGKLLMILLLYIKEDAALVRQPIYGLLIGNFLIVGLVMVLRSHETVSVVPGRLPDIGFVDEMGWLMVWGTVLLFLDAIAIILLYERLGTWLTRHVGLRFLICGAAVLTFDQAGFFLALHYVSGAPMEVLFGGWAAKMSATVVYTVFFMAYLRLFKDKDLHAEPLPFRDVFHVLTYRERYEDLLKTANTDFLTGVSHRRQFDTQAPALLERALDARHPASLFVLDIDHFKKVNDSYGHQAGDEVLATIARVLRDNQRSDDAIFRYGGEEFVILSARLGAEAALSIAERLRRTIAEVTRDAFLEPVTVSIGVAIAPQEGTTLEGLFERADSRLYEAKARGRNCVVGPQPETLCG
ncbi:GGDEF domain-containing protein [Polymorphum gilvum]|uniref:diguanylate cyclase n=1 Tax=Polymorphum gilvum (strain LMG 25793 / CGMCC 1.9160 / SL003B-26A1) TaxID=991905 RepID=F2J004_POLGS|nr:GGDEF domain-containing protein [Polymorphum gilvum]ADZ71839.1 Putative transmembrane GGDEF sensory box protein [Polymorphum gilvum SL003B-26A1]